MIAKIELTLDGSSLKIDVDLVCYDYPVTVGEVAWRLHSAIQRKVKPTSYFDDELPQWIFDDNWQPQEYKITSINMVASTFSGQINHDDFANMETPTVKRKPRRAKQEQTILEIDE